MATLTYWIAECLDDAACYSIVDKTKRGCQLKLEARLAQGPANYLRPAKRTILYKDAFDLMDQLTNEGEAVDTQTLKGYTTALVKLSKEQIVRDVLDLRVPVQVGSFSDLQDYVDANCYGGLCDDEFMDDLIAKCGGRDENEGMPDKVLKLIMDVQDEVDVWLRNDGLIHAMGHESWDTFTPYAYGELLMNFQYAMRTLDRIQSVGSPRMSNDHLAQIAREAWLDLRKKS